jgi:formamidopyrimidine-DNA glycosylase
MPELPEVRYLVDYLLFHCKNERFENIEIKKGRYKVHGEPDHLSEFKKSLPMKLTNVEHKGKTMVFNFENKWWIISKLGMMGWYYVNDEKPTWMRGGDSNILLTAGPLRLHYHDVLSYGSLSFTNSKSVIEKEFSKIAPEFIEIKLDELIERTKKKKNIGSKAIEDVLLDQKILFSGIGNYLKSEILYEARIHPKRTIDSMSGKDWEIFLLSAKKVYKRKFQSLGNTDKYMETMYVFNKVTDPLGNPVEKYKTKDNRTTYWVPKLQI